MATEASTLDTTRVKEMYREVAEHPERGFHFETGRPLAERLGYPSTDLDGIPAEAIESFAGVGYYFDLADLQPWETVVDLGSGSGMDAFLAARKVGTGGHVVGIDMTDAQLAKATALAERDGFTQIELRKAYIETLPLEDASVDVVISNGVINLSADKGMVFADAARVLRPGGRLAIADIVSTTQLPERITCDASLWAACIGGAMQRDDYSRTIEAVGLTVKTVRENTKYRFVSERADNATQKYGVKSISLLAVKPT
jgi:ubiquinone/menaquinone biosynthesis C-methylase UbiE